MVKAISEVEGVLSQTTPEVDSLGINQDSLHLIVLYYWKLQEQARVRWTKTLVMVAIKVVCIRAKIKIPQLVLVTLYDRTIYRE